MVTIAQYLTNKNRVSEDMMPTHAPKPGYVWHQSQSGNWVQVIDNRIPDEPDQQPKTLRDYKKLVGGAKSLDDRDKILRKMFGKSE